MAEKKKKTAAETKPKQQSAMRDTAAPHKEKETLTKEDKNGRLQRILTDMLFEIAGGMLIALATYNIALNASFPMSGFSGIAMIIYRLFGLPMGAVIVVLNIPVALLCGRRLGSRFILKTLRCMVISSVLLDYIAPLLPVYDGNRMIAALLTGVCGGLGYALIYIRGSSTGGLDFIIMYIKSRRPYVRVGTITMALDCTIISLTGFIFGDFDSIVYGMIINFLLAAVVDKVILGMNSGSVALIVTEHGRQIADLIDEVSMRGSTILKAQGGYRGDEKDVVMVAGSSKDLYQVNRAVKEADPNSFVIILNSKEVHGEGFHVTKVAGE